MVKKIILSSLCVFLAILLCGCFWNKKKEDKNTVKKDNIDGVIDKEDFVPSLPNKDDATYINSSAGLKFELPSDFKFVESNSIEYSEMSAEGKDCNINIFTIYVDTSEDLKKNIENSELKLKENCTCDVVRVNTEEAEVFCGQDYIKFEGSGFVGEKVSDVRGYIRRIGNYLFCVEVAYARDQKELCDNAYKAFSAVEIKRASEEQKENEDKNENESKDTNNELLASDRQKENKTNEYDPEGYDETKDTTVERSEDVLSRKYNKGTVNEVEGSYVNSIMGLNFELPEGFKFKPVERNDQEMLVENDNGSRCYVIYDKILKTSSMNKYTNIFVRNRKKNGNTILSEGKLENKEKFVGKDWRIIETTFNKDGNNYSEKTYIRIYNNMAVSITFAIKEGNNSEMKTLISAFSE